MAQEIAKADKLVVNAEGQETESRRESVTNILFTGDYNQIRDEIIDPLLSDAICGAHKPRFFLNMIAGQGGFDDLAYTDRQTGDEVSGLDIATSIAFIDAIVRDRFPAYDGFNPRPIDPDNKLAATQRVGFQANGLMEFFGAAGTIATTINSIFPRHPLGV